jgi:hypothetical protein
VFCTLTLLGRLTVFENRSQSILSAPISRLVSRIGTQAMLFDYCRQGFRRNQPPRHIFSKYPRAVVGYIFSDSKLIFLNDVGSAHELGLSTKGIQIDKYQ